MVPELIGPGLPGEGGVPQEQRRGQSRSPVLRVAPAASAARRGEVQVCVDLLLQQAVSKETRVCRCSYPGGSSPPLQDLRTQGGLYCCLLSRR